MYALSSFKSRKRDRVTIHPDKTKAVILNKPNIITRSNLHWKLGDKTVYPSEVTTHLGIVRAELTENQLNVEAIISLARRTLYSLINTGVHGSSGLNLKVSFKIYQCYVLPHSSVNKRV
jgi:hypothetical protein